MLLPQYLEQLEEQWAVQRVIWQLCGESAASSTLIEGIWDIADGTTEFTADNVTKLALDTVGSAVFGAE